MNHLLISREFPPSPYPAGGIGTYVGHIAGLLAAHGETVHVIAQQWPGAPRAREMRLEGRLIVHRVPLEAPRELLGNGGVADALRQSISCSGFLINATALAESLIEHAAIDIIEAQDYEAPAYLLLVRRSTAGGSVRRVPVVVHLHTPTEFVLKANGWEQDLAACAPIAHLEHSAIRAADALLCPSRFLAGIAQSQFGLAPGAVVVIPYPMGDTPAVRRDEDTWRSGTICYAGRLEPRKGVLEWMEAAVRVARDSTASFTFVGGDVPYAGREGGSVRHRLFSQLPDDLRSRFEFTGAVPRAAVVAHLRRARIAVVPSRWENFPYACVEAMASGLPVLASPSGGMAEMIEDGRTGWIADGHDPRSLEQALRRALGTTPEVLARMGGDAADSIAARCDNQRVTREHIEFRRHVVSLGCRTDAAVSLPLPPAVAADPAPAQGRTMGPVEILRASPQQRRDVLRRAIANPGYVAKWLAWHGREIFSRLGALT